MRTVRLSGIAAPEISRAQQIAARANVNLNDCYQCGKCAAGCPMASAMDFSPQQIMHLLMCGMADEALAAKSPWLCAQCAVCSARCPQKIDITRLMLEVRRVAHEAGQCAYREADVFDEAFLNGVGRNGRSNELYLAAAYNLKSGHLMQDADSAPAMLAKGLVGVKHNRTSAPSQVAEIIKRCEQKAGE